MIMPRRKGEVMWPRLIASKILSKRVGSNNFVADFPSDTETWLELPSLNKKYLSSVNILPDHEETETYKIFASTWNVGGVAPTNDLNMDDWLETCNTTCDVYVFGFQEVVPLRAANVFGCENKKITMQWNSIIREALNKKECKEKKGQNSSSSGDWNSFESEKSDSQKFRCIISKQMVGILISVWIRSDLLSFVRNPSVSCVGCGIMGCLGNKGSVSVRFRLHEKSFCFVCSHLASGGRGGDEKYRNSNAAEILSRTIFPRGPSLDLPRKILDHDRVVWLGDLNYRISLPESDTRLLVDKEEWNALLENDQLRTKLKDGQVFEGWQEGTIEFAPTYKYCPNSDSYYGNFGSRKGDKKRSPAWCDRIIWFGEGLKQQLYARGESKLSDHRPVKAIFSREMKISRKLKEFQSFFWSERFEQMTHSFDIHSADDFKCNARTSFQI
ncbi:type IV inositol polyphosphate 5-phosphatase 9-like isoform X1 [Coffea arabica]|uniref:Type IV inositol polyphosphate 5-phosphatase 9-like isoform X1 n=2 Tax=Coffea arabica TaxID=13443 RepID=A0A6P6V6D5_COFAR